MEQRSAGWESWLSGPVARGFPPESGLGPQHGPRPFQVFPANRPPFNPGFITEPPNRFNKPQHNLTKPPPQNQPPKEIKYIFLKLGRCVANPVSLLPLVFFLNSWII